MIITQTILLPQSSHYAYIADNQYPVYVSFIQFKYYIWIHRNNCLVQTAERIHKDDDYNMCECLPSCSELEYDTEVNSLPRNFSMSKGKTLKKYLGSDNEQWVLYRYIWILFVRK